MTGNTTIASERFNGTTLLRKGDSEAKVSISKRCVAEMLQDMDRPYETSAFLSGKLDGGRVLFDRYDPILDAIKLTGMIFHDTKKLHSQMEGIRRRRDEAIMHVHLHPSGFSRAFDMSRRSEAEIMAQPAGPSINDVQFYFTEYAIRASVLGFSGVYGAVLTRYSGFNSGSLRDTKYAKLEAYDILNAFSTPTPKMEITSIPYSIHDDGTKPSAARTCANLIRRAIDDIQVNAIGYLFLGKGAGNVSDEMWLG
ncbi:MAG: hypothetical protein KGH66_01560 [Candidatus Micrarchaeota archaeon]|nr:hypothetical protein [Candidatus Micrarchaeota archaeon]